MRSNGLSTNQIMRQVVYALALGIGASYYFFGWGVLLQIALGVITAVVAESVFLLLRKQDVKKTISDGSAILTAVLLAVAIPSIAPWWIIVVGVSFAIIFGKQIYGGLGNNPFNPAMLGYAFLLISYPLQMSTWQVDFLSFGQSLELLFNWTNIDAVSGATRLDAVKTGLSLGNSIDSLQVYSSSQAWINAGFLFGGLYLLLRRIIFWQIPASFIAGIAVTAFLISIGNADAYLPAHNHLILGGTMLGAFFIATDPVSASTTPRGRIIYGFLIGVLIVVIRSFGGYPDAVAFAVLLMNIAVPLIDYYTQPRIFGK